MPIEWMIVVISGAVILTLGLAYFALRPKDTGHSIVDNHEPSGDPREAALALRLSKMLGCSTAQALPSIRREIEYAPHQTDETLLKRAAYHYRQEQPESSCPVYQDKTRG